MGSGWALPSGWLEQMAAPASWNDRIMPCTSVPGIGARWTRSAACWGHAQQQPWDRAILQGCRAFATVNQHVSPAHVSGTHAGFECGKWPRAMQKGANLWLLIAQPQLAALLPRTDARHG